jgi:hypothetical protein
LLWKKAQNLEDALDYLKCLGHKCQSMCKWCIQEAQVTELIRTVYTVDADVKTA